MGSEVLVQLFLLLMDPKTRPGVPEFLVEMLRGADHVPVDLVDETNLLNSRGEI